jgi:hypothetical protein
LVSQILVTISEHREELFGSVAESVPDLFRELSARNAGVRAGGEPEPAQDAQAAAERVIDFANYLVTRERFDVLLKRLALGGVVAIAAIAAYAIISYVPPHI